MAELYVINSLYCDNPGKEPSFRLRCLQVAQDGKGYDVFAQFNKQKNSWETTLWLDASKVDGGEFIEAGDIIAVEAQIGTGKVNSAKKLHNKRLSIQIVPVKNPDLNAGK